MKKFLFGLLLAVASIITVNVLAQNEAEYLAEFIKLKDSHKSDWFNYRGSQAQEKTQLMARNHSQWADFKIEANNDWKNLSDISQKDEIFKKQLEKAVAIYEQQTQAWQQYWDGKDEAARQLAQRHKQELQTFKVKSGLAPAEEEKTDENGLTEIEEELVVIQPDQFKLPPSTLIDVTEDYENE
ncbi:hypothetical protein Noda2021_08660 [Candidatus Dependentiae bacterium Noda2021]|nr:hypothetical protein Noda2021_08660 [Candidatus Dependentiae bacterium Noda2021]